MRETNGRYRAVILDLDGTLVDSSADIASAMNHALRAYGIAEVTDGQVAAALGGGPRILVTACLQAVGHPSDDHALVDAVLDKYSAQYKAFPAVRTHTYDTAATVLPALHERGVLIGVCTNKRTQIALSVLDSVGLGAYVGAVVGSDTTTAPKPRPGHLTDTIAALGARERRVLYVGDTHIDRLTAEAAGVPYAQVAWGHPDVPADHHLSTFDDLLGLV